MMVGSNYYQIAQPVVQAGPTAAHATFSLTAAPVATSDQAQNFACTSLTLTDSGAQTATGSDPDPTVNCWN